LLGFFYALFGAVCWGIAPAFGKLGLKDVHPLDGLAIRTLLTVIIVGVFVGIWFISSGGIGRLAVVPGRNWYFIALEAFLATFAGDLAYYAAIKRGEIGQTSLVLAASPLLTLWVGWYFMGETVSSLKMVGAILIVIGVICISISSSY
jgi:transporter family protein